MDCADVVGVLLSAGRGSRLGGNKLEAMLGDAMLGEHAARTMAAMGFGALIAVHDPANRRLGEALAGLGFMLVANDDPAAGLSRSLRLAVQAAKAGDERAMLICLADMPFVTAAHLRAVLAAGGSGVVATMADRVAMPPGLFPRDSWSKLKMLSGDTGARMLLSDASAIKAAASEIADIDTLDDLEKAREQLAKMR